jgi:hypothetical protein
MPNPPTSSRMAVDDGMEDGNVVRHIRGSSVTFGTSPLSGRKSFEKGLLVTMT